MINLSSAKFMPVDKTRKQWWAVRDSNPRPSRCKFRVRRSSPYKNNDCCSREHHLSTASFQWLSTIYLACDKLMFVVFCLLIMPLCLISIGVQMAFERGW
jgi:hypothetical protein